MSQSFSFSGTHHLTPEQVEFFETLGVSVTSVQTREQLQDAVTAAQQAVSQMEESFVRELSQGMLQDVCLDHGLGL